MNNRTRSVFKVIAGGYLAYLGGTLFMDVMKSKPNNYVLFLIAGVFFIAIGGYLAISNLKGMMTPDETEEETEESEEESEEKTEKLEDKNNKEENHDSAADSTSEATNTSKEE